MPLTQLGAAGVARTLAVIGATAEQWAFAAAKHFSNSQVLLIDPDPAALAMVAQRAQAQSVPNLKTVLAEEPDEFPVASGSIDGVLLYLTYHQIDPASGFLGELRRIVQPTAPVVLVEWQPGAAALPATVEPLSDDDVIVELTSSGFSLRNRFAAGPAQYGLTFLPVADATE